MIEDTLSSSTVLTRSTRCPTASGEPVRVRKYHTASSRFAKVIAGSHLRTPPATIESGLSVVSLGSLSAWRRSASGDIPSAAVGLPVSEGNAPAWLIEGKKCGDQPDEPVGVPPIDDLLGRKLWKNQAIVPITAEDFNRIRTYTLDHQLATKTIPLFGRDPENEQEVLAMVVYSHKQLGIEKIIRVH